MWQQYCFVIFACLVGANAFWWPKTTTEAPNAQQMLQQIPLTYFRTYTYQPLAGGPFSVPFFGFGAAQTPLLSPSPHYDPYAVTSYAAARRHDTAAKTGVTPPPASSSTTTSTSSTTSTTTPAPTTTSTTTTTTTTTTPAPTTTTSSTTTPPPPEGGSFSASGGGSGATSSLLRYGEYPTYTRRVNNLYNARPQYPYPDYFNYQPQGGLAEPGVGVGVGGTRIQFVPCMCPVSVPSLGSSLPSAAAGAPAAVGSASTSNPAARHIDSHEMQSDAELDADAEVEADPEASDDEEEDVEEDEGVTAKVLPDPQETTPNSPRLATPTTLSINKKTLD